MWQNISLLLIGILIGIFVGAWGLPRKTLNKVEQSIKKIKGNTSPVSVSMENTSPERVKFLGLKLWRKKRK